MTTVTNLPDVPSADAIPHARTRAREAPRHVASAHRAVQRARAGGSVWHAPPPSLAEIWARHDASARYYNGWLGRCPRYAWGGLHIVLAACVYLLAWATDSPPKLVLTAAVLAAAVLLLGGF
jgi:hypothetical protein